VADYIAYRPGYPEAILPFLVEHCRLAPGSAVADVGCGTGKLAELLLKAGCEVYGVEPNDEMRLGAEALLGDNPRFHSVAGAAEESGLPTASVQLVTAGQAFHWFERGTAGEEFRRILRPAGRVALIWNDRREEATPFMAAYDALLLECSPEYRRNTHRGIEAEWVRGFFAPGSMVSGAFPHRQNLTLEGLLGRARSSSYAPASGQSYERLMAGLSDLFEAYGENGTVAFHYTSKVFCGSPA
jgi:SAM-dependent methyltransferase